MKLRAPVEGARKGKLCPAEVVTRYGAMITPMKGVAIFGGSLVVYCKGVE